MSHYTCGNCAGYCTTEFPPNDDCLNPPPVPTPTEEAIARLVLGEGEEWLELRRLVLACSEHTSPGRASCSYCEPRWQKIRAAVERLRQPEVIAREQAQLREMAAKIAALEPKSLRPRRRPPEPGTPLKGHGQ